MDRRGMLGAMGVTGLSLAGGRAWAEDEPPAGEHDHHAMMDKVHMDCLKACGECAKACNESLAHCLAMLGAGKGDLKHHARAHSLAMDCAEFCTLSAAMIARKSLLMAYSCDACSDACRLCAEECAKSDSAMMKECAAKCRACEATCRQMVKQMKVTASR